MRSGYKWSMVSLLWFDVVNAVIFRNIILTNPEFYFKL